MALQLEQAPLARPIPTLGESEKLIGGLFARYWIHCLTQQTVIADLVTWALLSLSYPKETLKIPVEFRNLSKGKWQSRDLNMGLLHVKVKALRSAFCVPIMSISLLLPGLFPCSSKPGLPLLWRLTRPSAPLLWLVLCTHLACMEDT